MRLFQLNGKKYIAIITALCILLGSVPAFAAVPADDSETDYGLLTALNIIPDDNDGNSVVTRGYLARVICGLQNLHPVYSNNANVSDISEETEYAAYIAASLKGNYMKCAVAGSFLPERNATIEEIATAAVILCGFDVTVKNKNEQEYMAAAHKLKLISAEKGEITKKELWNIALNCLDTDIPIISYSSSANEVRLSDDNTLLENVFECYRDEGIITANHITSLAAPNDAYEDYVMIDGMRFRDVSSQYGDYLGMNCKYVYRKNRSVSEKYELVWASPFNNKILSVTETNGPSYSKGVFRYGDEKGKSRECKFSATGDIIYNGQSYNSLNDSEWTDGKCDITLIDNDSNGTYDVAFVNKYENYLVKKVFADSFKIQAISDCDWDKNVVLDFEDAADDGLLEVYRRGKPADISSVISDDVISVFSSKSGYKFVAAEGSSAETTLSGIKSAKNIILCNAKEFYCYDTSLFEKYLGKKITLYLDAYANAAFVKESETSKKAGYLLGADYNKFYNEAKVKILESSGETEIYNIAENYTHNGENKKISKDGISSFWESSIDTAQNRKLILYTAVKGTGIIEIETPVENTEGVSTDRLRLTFEKLERIYRPQSKSFLERKNAFGEINKIPRNCAISDSCVFFMIPEGSVNDDDISVGTVGAFKLNQWVELTGYSTSNAKRIDVAVVNGSSDTAESNWKNYGLVTNVTKVYDNKSDETLLCIAFADGNKVKIDNKYKNIIAMALSLRYGDVIRYDKDLNGYLSNYAKYFDFNLMKSLHDEDETLDAMRTIYGTVTDVTDNLVTVEGANGFEYVENIYFARNALYLINTETEQCDKLSVESIKPGDRLLLLSKEETIAYGVVYK